MKKLSLTLAALALVLGMSQCKKQEEPVQNGEKQHIVLTANNGNDGSKVAANFASAVLNLTWEGNESITVSGGASGMLTYKSGVGTPNATFEGDITIDRGGDIVFTIGDAPSSYANQTGTADDCAAWINANNHFVGTSQWQDNGNYNVTMELQYAVLKLNVSALGTSGLLTIAAGGETVASVTNVSGIANAVFVAVPTDETEKAYTITCGDKTATKTWTLEKNVFYTKADAEGAGTGDAIVIELDAPATPKFSVGSSKTVEFAPGNLWYGIADGETTNAFHFEENQWNYSEGVWDDTEECYIWVSSHVSHFYWSEDAAEAIKEGFKWGQPMSDKDVFFTNDPKNETKPNENFQVSGETKGTWRTLSKDEWAYLLNTSGSSGRNDVNRFARALVNGVKGLLVFPDGYTLPSGYTTADGGTGMAKVNKTSLTDAPWPDASIPETTWTSMETSGAVFLPAAGYRNGTDVTDAGSYGVYWSGTPSENDEDYAYYMDFYSDDVYVGDGYRDDGLAVRLVR